MPSNNTKKNYSKDKCLYHIIRHMHMCRLMTKRMFKLLKREKTYAYENIMTKLVNTKYIEKYKTDIDITVYCFNDYEKNKNEYLENMPKGYVENYLTFGKEEVYSIRRSVKKDKKLSSRIQKPISDAEALFVIHEAGINSYIDEKPFFDKLTEKNNNDTIYYTSKEIKRGLNYKDAVEIKDNIKKIGTTRITGALLSPNANYLVYNFGKNLTTWFITGEYKIEQELNRYSVLNIKNTNKFDSGIIFCNSLNIFTPIFLHDKKIRGFEMDNIIMLFNHLYIFQYETYTIKHLQLLFNQNLKNKIDNIIFPNRNIIEYQDLFCDNYNPETEVYELSFCIPDLIKLKYFLNKAYLENKKNSFVIYCFDFQKEFLIKVGLNKCKIKTTSLNLILEEIEKR